MPERSAPENFSLTSSEAEAGLPVGSGSDLFGQTSWAVKGLGCGEDERTLPGAFTPPPTMARTLPSIPGYHVLGELGRGGMGVVYKAVQLGLNRLVALKMILVGGHASGDALARFRREAEAIAKLQHPHIVQIHDIGTQDGQPFFSLEYVNGGSLAEYLKATPQAPLASAALVESLARAMHVVHQQGIIHRDLKPGNILLATTNAAEPLSLDQVQPKITDFGLAKEESSELTASNAAVGTPSYMSPEQAQGAKHITPAADVYSLGAILYEMLTGRPPFKAMTPLETVLLVLSEDPIAPRLLQPGIPRDLETICLKCLLKEPSRRYATAEDLAADLHRFREGQPIAARPVGQWERAGRWCRRNRLAALFLAVTSLSLLAALISLTIGLWLAEQGRTQAELAHQEAQRRSQQYRQALDQQTAFVLEDLLARQAVLTEEHKTYLRKALQAYEAFTQENGKDEQSRVGLVEAFDRVAKIRQRLGQSQEGEAAFRQALAEVDRLRKDFPEKESHRLLQARLRNNLGSILLRRGDLAAAEAVLQLAQKELSEQQTSPAQQTLAREVLVLCDINLAQVQDLTGRATEAETTFRRAVQRARELYQQDSTSLQWQHRLAEALSALGALLGRMGRHADAAKAFHESLSLREQLVKRQPDAIDHRLCLANNYSNLATLAVYQDDPFAAEKAFQAALALEKQLVTEFPADPTHRHSLAKTYQQHAYLLRVMKRLEEAEKELRLALGLMEKLLREAPERQDYHATWNNTMNGLAILLDTTQRFAEAEEIFQRVIEADEKLVQATPGQPSPVLALGGACFNYALFLHDRNQLVPSKRYYDRAIGYLAPLVQQEPHSRDTRGYLTRAYQGRAELLSALGDHAAAVQDWDALLATQNPPKRILHWRRLVTLARAGQTASALAAAEQLLQEQALTDVEEFQAACLYAVVCAAEPNTARKDHWAAQALRHLQTASKKGFFIKRSNQQLLREEETLASLRARPDFQQWLAQTVKP